MITPKYVETIVGFTIMGKPKIKRSWNGPRGGGIARLNWDNLRFNRPVRWSGFVKVGAK